MGYLKAKAEIFKLSVLGKLLSEHKKTSKNTLEISKVKNDELGYFSALDNI